jgi:hypothetical protein
VDDAGLVEDREPLRDMAKARLHVAAGEPLVDRFTQLLSRDILGRERGQSVVGRAGREQGDEGAVMDAAGGADLSLEPATNELPARPLRQVGVGDFHDCGPVGPELVGEVGDSEGPLPEHTPKPKTSQLDSPDARRGVIG